MPTIQRGDAKLHYFLDDFTDPWRSDPEAIVLQHGFSRSGKFWYNWPPLLGREYRVIRPDIRGMGQSAPDCDWPFHIHGFRGHATSAGGYPWQKLLSEHARSEKIVKNMCKTIA